MKKNLILLSIIILFITACSGNDKPDSKERENAHASETKPEIIDNLPERNFEGYNFRLFLPGTSGAGYYVKEENGEIINDAIFERNRTVEERFNIAISQVSYSAEWDDRMEGRNFILAGDDDFDLMVFHSIVAFQYANEELVLDWFEYMTYVDLSSAWWNQDVINECSFFGKLYCVNGDISYTALSNTLCLFFNKNLFDIYDIKYPYDDVVNGTWTVDKLYSITKLGSADLNGDGVITADADRYGFDMANVYSYPTTALYCGGDRVIKKDSDGLPVLTVYNERTVNIYEKLFDILRTNCAAIRDTTLWGNPDNIDIFKDGRALVGAGGMGTIVAYRAMEDEIGIIPAPKYDETTTPKYYSIVEAYGRLLTVPVTANNLERLSIITEALCAEGHRTIIPTYYERALKTKFSRDAESETMLDYIKNSAVYDYGYLNSSSLTGVLAIPVSILIYSNNPDFTSHYNGNERSVHTNIEKLIEQNKK